MCVICAFCVYFVTCALCVCVFSVGMFCVLWFVCLVGVLCMFARDLCVYVCFLSVRVCVLHAWCVC